MPTLSLTGDAEADDLLSSNPLALLLGMLLDQQVPMEWAFASPARLTERLDGDLTPQTIAAMQPDALEEIFRQKPALHRYPGSMAKRAHALCQHVVEHFGGDAAAVWESASDPDELWDNLSSLPGFGAQKSKIFIALLGKQLGAAPEGWERVAGDYASPGHRSIADVVDEESLGLVREWKQAQKAKKKSAKKKASS